MSDDKAPVALWRGDGLAAFDKPPGCETIVADGSGGAACFTTRLRQAENRPAWRPVHRLDRDTSGVQLFADRDDARLRAEQWFRERNVEKIYLALCLGAPRNRTGTIRRALSEWRGGHRPVQVVKHGGLAAETGYVRVYATPSPHASGGSAGTQAAGTDGDAAVPADRHALIAFFPHQGRTHQIRVHAAALGHPILGDDQYGDRPANRRARERVGLRRQALHAWRLRIPAGEAGAETPTIAAPVPEDMLRALDGLLPGWRAAFDAWVAALDAET